MLQAFEEARVSASPPDVLSIMVAIDDKLSPRAIELAIVGDLPITEVT